MTMLVRDGNVFEYVIYKYTLSLIFSAIFFDGKEDTTSVYDPCVKEMEQKKPIHCSIVYHLPNGKNEDYTVFTIPDTGKGKIFECCHG